MGLPAKAKQIAEFKKISALQQGHLRNTPRRPASRKAFKPCKAELIEVELNARFSKYIARDAESVLDKIESVVYALQNEALFLGVSPRHRHDLVMLTSWKEELRTYIE